MRNENKNYLKRIKIFIGSPKDLQKERLLFPQIIQNINEINAKSKGYLFEPIGWEDTLIGRGRPQDKINNDLVKCDLIILLLWKRWGSPTDKFSSGFEEEYKIADSLDKEIWLYFKNIPDEFLEDPGEQLRKVLTFRNMIESEKRFLYAQYENEIKWEQRLRKDIHKWLDNLPEPKITSELDNIELNEYKNKVSLLEQNINNIAKQQKQLAQSLLNEAKEFVRLGHFTKAEEFFA